jgi:hypothetical protein
MTDYVKKPTIYKRVQFTGDPAAFLAELQAETSAWWNWAVYPGEGENAPVVLRHDSNAQQFGFLEVQLGWFVVFRDGPEEKPYIDYDGSSVVPA